MSEWEIFWLGYASGVMTGAGLVWLLCWWVRYVERKVLNGVARSRRPR